MTIRRKESRVVIVDVRTSSNLGLDISSLRRFVEDFDNAVKYGGMPQKTPIKFLHRGDGVIYGIEAEHRQVSEEEGLTLPIENKKPYDDWEGTQYETPDPVRPRSKTGAAAVLPKE